MNLIPNSNFGCKGTQIQRHNKVFQGFIAKKFVNVSVFLKFMSLCYPYFIKHENLTENINSQKPKESNRRIRNNRIRLPNH